VTGGGTGSFFSFQKHKVEAPKTRKERGRRHHRSFAQKKKKGRVGEELEKGVGTMRKKGKLHANPGKQDGRVTPVLEEAPV